MAATDITFTGLTYLNGVTVSCAIAGLDCGDFLVTQGTIVVPLASNPSLTAGFIAQVSAKNLKGSNITPLTIGEVQYFVPVVIGRKFTSTGQMMRPATQNDVKSQTGDALGHRRRGFQYSFLFSKTSEGIGGVAAGQLSIGTGFYPASTMWPAKLRQADSSSTFAGTVPFNGVHWDALDDASGFDTRLTWRVSRPVPVTVAAAAVHLRAEDR